MSEPHAEVAAPPKRRPGRPRAEVKRPMVSFRIDADLLAAFKATGRGWQTRMHDLIREAVAQGRL